MVLGSFPVSCAQPQNGMNQGPTDDMDSEPSLKIIGLNFSDDNPMEEDEVTVYFQVLNNGNVTINNIIVTIYLDNVIIENITNLTVAPNSLEPNEYKWTAEAGIYAVKAAPDVSSQFAESEETSNVKTLALSSLAPDLIIQDITWLPENPSLSLRAGPFRIDLGQCLSQALDKIRRKLPDR